MMIKTNRGDDDEVTPMRCMLYPTEGQRDSGTEERIRGQAIGSCTSPFGICIRFVGRMFLPAAYSPWSNPFNPPASSGICVMPDALFALDSFML